MHSLSNLYFLLLMYFVPVPSSTFNTQFYFTQPRAISPPTLYAQVYPQIQACSNFFNIAVLGVSLVAGRCFKGQMKIKDSTFVVHSIYIIIPGKFAKKFELLWIYPIQNIINRRQQYIGVEDPRFFYFKEWYMQFTGDASDDTHVRTMNIISVSQLMENQMSSVISTNIKNQKVEKNWAFFGETNMHAIYELKPFTVGIVHHNQLQLLWRSNFDCLQGHVTIASNIIKLQLASNSYYLLIYHDREDKLDYSHHVLLIQGYYPFRPLRRSSRALSIDAPKKQFIYISSISTANGDPVAHLDSPILISGGIDDVQGITIKTRMDKLLSSVTLHCNDVG